jgi:thiamine biosynthesis protein ThiS
MEIKLNHKHEKVETSRSSISVNELLSIKNFTFEMLIIKINGALIQKENYSTAKIIEGDDVHVIHVFGGG